MENEQVTKLLNAAYEYQETLKNIKRLILTVRANGQAALNASQSDEVIDWIDEMVDKHYQIVEDTK